jgi:hypothetical protein
MRKKTSVKKTSIEKKDGFSLALEPTVAERGSDRAKPPRGHGGQRIQLPGTRGRQLTGLWVTFQTLDDDKDWDSTIAIQVDNYTYLVGQGNCGYGSAFPDWTRNGPFAVPIAGYYDHSHLANGQMWIGIYPNGNDTWRFQARLDFYYSDGYHEWVQWNPTWVSESSRWARHPWHS